MDDDVIENDVLTVTCPYCWAPVQIWLDPTDRGEMVLDCEVCCQPWLVRITEGGQVTVERAQ